MSKQLKKSLHTSFAIALATSSMIPIASAEIVTPKTTDLIISEYIEGSSNNKAIEIFNGTGGDVDLSQYTIDLYTNGGTTPGQSLKLQGTLKDGGAYVIANSQAIQALKDKANITSQVTNFNGDDALVLKKGTTIIDSFGQVGISSNFGTDVTLVRKSHILSGDTIINDAFTPDKEWNSFTKDTFDNLGTHTLSNDEGPPVDPTLQTVSIADARTKTIGTLVQTKGIVTAILKNTVHIQDGQAAIALHPKSKLSTVSVGDEIVVKGNVSEFNNLLQMQTIELVETTGQKPVPVPLEVTGAQVNNEANESKLVTARNITLKSVSSSNYIAEDALGTQFTVRDENNTLGLEVGKTFAMVTGIVQQFGETYQIIPRSQADISEDNSKTRDVLSNTAAGPVAIGTKISLSSLSENAKIYYTLDGSNPTTASTLYTEPIKITKDTTIKAFAKADGLKDSDITTFEYKAIDPSKSMQIHDIQGAGHNSPLVNKTVTDIPGIVTYTYKLNGGAYFHIQTPDNLVDNDTKTSEGIIVYAGNSSTVKVGDSVKVTGSVSEYYIDGYSDKNKTDLSVTQLNTTKGKVEVVASNVALPAPLLVDENNLPKTAIDSDKFEKFNPDIDAIDFWESIEGMRVQFNGVKTVAPQEHGDLITVLESRKTDTIHGGVLLTNSQPNPDRIHFKLYDNSAARNFTVATGDKFTGPIIGVVNYGYQNYKVYANLADMQKAHVKGTTKPQDTTIVKQEDKLTIASYNLENFSNNNSSTSNAKAEKLATAIVKNMKNPDIIGVTEVQDNDGQIDSGNTASEKSYQRIIDNIKAAGGPTYKFMNIDPENKKDGGAPGGNIRVGFLYNPERVNPTQGIAAGTANEAVKYKDGKLTLNPGRIDPTNDAFTSSRKPLAAQFTFQGEDVIVISNHWNSKSGDSPLFGQKQPPNYGSEVQRKEIATVVSNFIDEVKVQNPKANIISLGDFNDFQFSEALKIHEGKHMTNMINAVEESKRYTYVFQGNSQVLDHILVSNNLSPYTDIDIIQINADFTEMAGRASDHNPVLAQVDLKPAKKTAITYNLENVKMKKLTLTKPIINLTINQNVSIPNGIFIKSDYAVLNGTGFADKVVTIEANKPGKEIDFKGITVKEVVIKGDAPITLLNKENVKKITYTK